MKTDGIPMENLIEVANEYLNDSDDESLNNEHAPL